MTYTLQGEHPDLSDAIDRLREKARVDGIEFDTADFGGVRTLADTTKILKYRDDDYATYVNALKARDANAVPVDKGIWRPIAPFGTSMHNYGAARDLKILKKPASFSEAEAYRRLGSIAPTCGLKWGGTFRNKVDPPHFELPITLAQAKDAWDMRQTAAKGDGSAPAGTFA